MTNIVILIGTGYYGEDVLHKLPWISHLNKKHNVYIISRIEPSIHLSMALNLNLLDKKFIQDVIDSMEVLKLKSKDFSSLYVSDFFSKCYSNEDIEKIQFWLGIPLIYVSSFDRRFYKRENNKELRSKKMVNNYAAALVDYYRQYFANNKIEI